MEKERDEHAPPSLRNFLDWLADEPAALQRVTEIRAALTPEAFGRVSVQNRDEAADSAVRLVMTVLHALNVWRGFMERSEPGHGAGHLLRDHYHGLRLTRHLDLDPRDLFIGLTAGTLHDIGCVLVRRYEEAGKVIRHAEAGALFVDWALKRAQACSDVERDLIAYAIAAHTHYLKPTPAKTAAGADCLIQPYVDCWGDEPIWSVWLTRWCDRLDVNGPAFVGRHFLTLNETHEDFDKVNQRFYVVELGAHLRPILRTEAEIKAAGGRRTMLEHLQMFASSQTNASPFGRFDFGEMVSLRDAYRERLDRIIKAVLAPPLAEPTPADEAAVQSWLRVVEPTANGARTADALIERLRGLEPDARRAWLYGLRVAAQEYADWSRSAAASIGNRRFVTLPGIGRLSDILMLG